MINPLLSQVILLVHKYTEHLCFVGWSYRRHGNFLVPSRGDIVRCSNLTGG